MEKKDETILFSVPSEQPPVDLEERRKTDKTKMLSTQDKKVFLEQQQTGAVMDRMVKREQFLVKNKKQILDDDSLFLYRLPLNEEQIKNMYESITDQLER